MPTGVEWARLSLSLMCRWGCERALTKGWILLWAAGRARRLVEPTRAGTPEGAREEITMRIRTAAAAATAAVGLAGMVLAVPAAAAPVRTDVEREKNGRCTATSYWDLNLEKERGRIDIDVDIESLQAGEQWTV